MSFTEELDLDLREYMKPQDGNNDSQFDSLSFDDKLSKLQELVQKSQVYSQIILDNMLERSVEKKKKQEEERRLAAQREQELKEEEERKKAKQEEKLRRKAERKAAKEGADDASDLPSDSSDTRDLSSDASIDEDSDSLAEDVQEVKEQIEVPLDSDVEIVEVRHSARLGGNQARTERVRARSKRMTATKTKKAPKPKNVEPKMKTKVSAETEKMRRAIEAAQTGHTQQQPALVTGCVMKDYQLDGLEWLVSLYENGLNGILADEMGLGKTLQCIALFSFLIENKVDGPFMVVAPLSTVRNWGSEFRKFAPDIDIIEYVGQKDKRKLIKLNNRMKQTVVITSYELVIRDFRRFSRISWGYLTVDEGHRLKNFQSILIQFLKKLKTANRLLLTGTPLQNNLNELWSLLNFILPDIFHDLELFERWFNFDELTGPHSLENEEQRKAMSDKLQLEIVKSLHTVLKPFLLRRVKKEVMKDLPPKKEYMVYTDLQPLQQIVYCSCVQGNLLDKLLELYVKEYLLHNEKHLFSSVQDLEKVDEVLSKLVDPSARYSNKKRKVSYLMERYDRALDSAIFSDDEDYEDEIDNANDAKSQEEIDLENSLNQSLHTEGAKAQLVDPDVANQTPGLSESEGEKIMELERTNETRETSVERSPGDQNKKRSYSEALVDSVGEEIDSGSPDLELNRNDGSDSDYPDIEIVEDPGIERPRGKRQALLILKAYRIAEQKIKRLALKSRLMSYRAICGSHYSYYFPFPPGEDLTEKMEEEFARLLVHNSGKMQLLEQLVERLLKDNHKVLVFSQFTFMLDLILEMFSAASIRTSRIDSNYSIDERRDEIEKFSHDGKDSSQVFLISTRAGGLGLNLTEADTVIIFDNDWNPQMDLQAIDRVHRIGQTKPVKIFRFVVRDTIEEIIVMRSFGKRALEQMVIRLGAFQLSRVAKKLADEKIDINSTDATRSLSSIGERLNMQGLGGLGKIPDTNETLIAQAGQKTQKLLAEEMEELMDRSSECYSREPKEYPNLTSFESLNNMDD